MSTAMTAIVAQGPSSGAPPRADLQLDASHAKTAALIFSIINRYAFPEKGSSEEGPSKDTKFLDQIYSRVANAEPIFMCLPAFPFKSPNTTTKVLGRLPDKAEEFALAHLNGLCRAIEDVYCPGAKLRIISDGLVYNGMPG